MPDCDTALPRSPFTGRSSDTAAYYGGDDTYARKHHADETITVDGGDDDPDYDRYNPYTNSSAVSHSYLT